MTTDYSQVNAKAKINITIYDLYLFIIYYLLVLLGYYSMRNYNLMEEMLTFILRLHSYKDQENGTGIEYNACSS